MSLTGKQIEKKIKFLKDILQLNLINFYMLFNQPNFILKHLREHYTLKYSNRTFPLTYYTSII